MHKSFLLLLLLAGCAQRQTLPEKATQFENQSGQIQVFVCGRGCAQHILQVDGVRYMPVGLPEEFKVDQVSVRFSGELQADSTVINTFGPDDRLIPDFKVRNLSIKQIVKQ